MIKQKIGSCSEEGCGYFGGLIAKKCPNHYWKSRAAAKKDSPAERIKTAEDKADKRMIGVFFANQILQIPDRCEECGHPLGALKAWKPKIIIAHILPKRKVGGFPRLAIHPQNRMFFCWDCHTDFDNKGAEHARNMKSFPLMRERFFTFKQFLTEAELVRVPEYLK